MRADRQAQAGAIRLVGKKGLEQPRTNIGGYAKSSILHLHERDTRPGDRANGERSAAGHRLDRVQNEVEEDLAQLVAIADDLGESMSGREDDSDRLVPYI